MFASRRDVEHLFCRYRYRSARKIEPPCSLEDEDHLFVVMTVRMRNRTFFDFNPGHGNVFANRNFSLIEITDLFPSHRIPIVESHLSTSLILVLCFINQPTFGEPWHHMAQLRADAFDLVLA